MFGTSNGGRDNRNNVRRRPIVKAAERANVKLAEAAIEPFGKVSPHSLRRTYASLRCAAGDDPVYVSAQLGHESPEFTLRMYAQAVKRRERLTPAERKEYDEAIRWGSMGTKRHKPGGSLRSVAKSDTASIEKAPHVDLF